MTQEKFIKVVEEEDYSYEIQGNKIVVTHDRDVYFSDLTSLPPGVKFENEGSVFLFSLTSLPPGVVFENGGSVWLESITSLPPGVVFENGGSVWLESLIGGWLDEWKGNIEDIYSKRLLNSMINKGVFER